MEVKPFVSSINALFNAILGHMNYLELGLELLLQFPIEKN